MQHDPNKNVEVILASEYGASRKIGTLRHVSGTLLLTSLRIIFIDGDSVGFQDRDPGYQWGRFNIPTIFFTEIYDADQITPMANSHTSRSISISINSIISAAGFRGIVQNPTLKISWRSSEDQQEFVNEEFQQQMTGRRQKNLDEWGGLITKLMSGELDEKINRTVERLSNPPDTRNLEGKVFFVLVSLQSKDVYEIMMLIEKRFGGSFLPDDVTKACNNLVEQGWLEQITGEEILPDLYRRVPPLGEEYDVTNPF